MKTNVNSGMVILAVLGLLALCGSVAAVDDNDLVSHWMFDEVQGSIAYDSAGNNDGTLINGPTWTTGQIDGALSFDGVDDYVDVGDPVDGSLDFGAADSFSISAWIKPNKADSPVVNKRRCTGPGGYYYEGYQLWVIQDILFLAIEDTSGNEPSIFGTAVVTDDQWHHVVAIRDTATDELYLYVDGSSDATPVTDNTTATLATSEPFEIGHRLVTLAPGHRYFGGVIDDVRIYDIALSLEEIWQIYQGELADVVGLEITGPDEVPENSSASYKAIAYYDNNNTSDITGLVNWAVEPNTAANIDENGVLTTKDVVRDQPATILASYTEGDVTVEAEKAIDIFAICPTGTALQFDGVDDYVNLGNESSLKPPLPVTFSAWIKLSNLGGQAIVNLDKQRREGYYGVWFQVSSRSRLEGSFGDGRGGGSPRYRRTKEGATVLTTDNWYHVAAVLRGPEDIDLYINGADDGGPYSGTGGALSYSDTDAFIGSTHGSATYFHGKMDEVAIYNRALSAEEIRANMHTRLTGDEPGLLGYWDFDEGEGQIVYDLSGNGNDGQLGSTPNPDASDPAWVDSDAPIGVCSLYQIATIAVERALERKTALLEELLAALAEEWTAYEALEEWLESRDYGDLNKGDIVKAKQKIHSATQHQEQVIDALEKSIEKLKDALRSLGCEAKP